MRSMKNIRHPNRRGARRSLLLPLGMAVLLCAVFVVGFRMENAQREQARGVATQDVGLLRRMTYEGKPYVEKAGLTSLLLMGVDQTSDAGYYGARQGGQADFLVLVTIDHENREIRQLHIDRDTMVDVDTLSVMGKPQGLRNMQICLSHAFGADATSCALNTQAAVERLLAGLDVDYYIAMNVEAIGALNQALGGIEVTLEEDYAYLDAAMTKGASLRLTDEQAYNLVQRRLDVGDGTNEARMARQVWFMQAVLSQLRARLSESPSFIETLFDQLAPYMATNMAKGRMAAEANQAYHYNVSPAEKLAGEHTIGSDGFVEFHVDEAQTERWAAQTLFKPDIY